MKSPVAIVIVLLVLVAGGYFFMQKASPLPASDTNTEVTNTTKTMIADEAPVKEFSMTAYYDAQGKWFSLKEMSVKKGDHVRVKVTNTAGMHDFSIDEFGIREELPLNREFVVDFVADQVGSFQYYCSYPGHRAGGQWGTLTVSE